jgi:hypothetical protein
LTFHKPERPLLCTLGAALLQGFSPETALPDDRGGKAKIAQQNKPWNIHFFRKKVADESFLL